MRLIVLTLSILTFSISSNAEERCEFMEQKIRSRIDSFRQAIEEDRLANQYQMQSRSERTSYNAKMSEEIRFDERECNLEEYRRVFLSEFRSGCKMPQANADCAYDNNIERTIHSHIQRAQQIMRSIAGATERIERQNLGPRCSMTNLRTTLEEKKAELLVVKEDMQGTRDILTNQSSQCNQSMAQHVLGDDCINSLDGMGHMNIDAHISSRIGRFCPPGREEDLLTMIKNEIDTNAAEVCEGVTREESRAAQNRRLENAQTRIDATVERLQTTIEEARTFESRLVASEEDAAVCNPPIPTPRPDVDPIE